MFMRNYVIESYTPKIELKHSTINNHGKWIQTKWKKKKIPRTCINYTNYINYYTVNNHLHYQQITGNFQYRLAFHKRHKKFLRIFLVLFACLRVIAESSTIMYSGYYAHISSNVRSKLKCLRSHDTIYIHNVHSNQTRWVIFSVRYTTRRKQRNCLIIFNLRPFVPWQASSCVPRPKYFQSTRATKAQRRNSSAFIVSAFRRYKRNAVGGETVGGSRDRLNYSRWATR